MRNTEDTQLETGSGQMINTSSKANGSGAPPVGRRAHPQESFAETTIEPGSFYGKVRSLFASKVLKTQLEQLRKQGSYNAFKLGWHPAYDVRRLKGAKARPDGIPPSLFWESDVGKWIEAASYFLSTSGSPHKAEFDAAIDELVEMIASAQHEDGYLNIYFTVVDPEGRFKNLRDMHEMYNAGHLLEGALAHYRYTGSRKFLDVMIKNVDCFMRHFGPNPNQAHGYPGHPELELAVLRLYSLTKDPRHRDFALYLLNERGTRREDQKGERYFIHEAMLRDDLVVAHTMDDIFDIWYHQAHKPLHEQKDILGHSVRAFYLITAAADAGGPLLDDAIRLWVDAVDRKMYVTGGFGTEPRGGCYAETCASIAAMMCSERILSHGLTGKVRDVMELCLLNAVLGGGSLDGTSFSYANKLATWGNETAIRNEWFEVCCCPPNLSRTLGMLGGYTWSAHADPSTRTIQLDVYLLLSASRTIDLGGNSSAKVTMTSEMPWKGGAQWVLDAPDGWSWVVRVPKPEYAEDIKLSVEAKENDGFLVTNLPAHCTLALSFSMPVRLLSPHPGTYQDTLTVTRGPIVYVAESIDNPNLDTHHFADIGLTVDASFEPIPKEIEGIQLVALAGKAGDVWQRNDWGVEGSAYKVAGKKGEEWVKKEEKMILVPWFARANRGGKGRVRTSFQRVCA